MTIFQLTPTNPRPPQRAGEMLPVLLEQTIMNHTGDDDPGSHPVGRAEVLSDGRLRVTITDHLAGRHAVEMIRADLLDVVIENGSVRLRVL